MPGELDFGDAPTAAQSGFISSYPTTTLANGARHIIGGPRLGANVDLHSDGQATANADGDDTSGVPDDEDGVTFVSPLRLGNIATVSINLQNPGSTNKLDAWIDFNRDGDWNDPGEQIFTSFVLGTTAGLKNLSFTVPAGALLGDTFARFRVSTAGGLAATGRAPAAEGR